MTDYKTFCRYLHHKAHEMKEGGNVKGATILLNKVEEFERILAGEVATGLQDEWNKFQNIVNPESHIFSMLSKRFGQEKKHK